MVSRLIITVPDDKLEEVKKAITEKVSNADVHNALVVYINGDNAAEALMVAMAAGAFSAFEA